VEKPPAEEGEQGHRGRLGEVEKRIGTGLREKEIIQKETGLYGRRKDTDGPRGGNHAGGVMNSSKGDGFGAGKNVR